MQTTITEERGYLLIRVNGRLDSITSPYFEEDCLTKVDAGNVFAVLDLSELEYISSAGLRSILVLGKKAKSGGGNFYLCGLVGVVQEVISMAGFEGFFHAFPTFADIPERK